MSVYIPENSELYNQILQDIATEFDVDVSTLGKTYQVEAKVQAGMLWIAYLSLSGVQKNIYYDLAEESVLIRYGNLILGRKPAPAEAGEYTCEITGDIGAVIAASTQFIANDDTIAAGKLFILDQEFTLTAETDNITLRALEPGTDAALFVDDLLTSTAPIANVNSSAKVIDISKNPVAAESIASYRVDVIQKSQIEPQGGSPGDYRLWSLEEPTVRTTYPFAKDGNPGDVEIYVEATEENTAPAEIIGVPTQDTLDAIYKNDNNIETGVVVINPITAKGRKPIGVFNVYSLPVTPVTVDVLFTDLSDENIAPTLKTAIDNFLYTVRPFVGGADIVKNKKDILTIGQITAVVATILANTGISFTTLVMEVDGIVVNSYQFLLGNYPYLRYLKNNGGII